LYFHVVNFLPLIEAKRDGRALTDNQIKEIIAASTAGGIPDYQMAAFLMAVYFRGLNAAETAALTRAQVLTQSGTQVLAIANQQPQNVLALLRNL